MPTVTIGCRLPNGLVLNPEEKDLRKRITLNGQNRDPAFRRAPFIVLTGDSFGTTDVDQEFWQKWRTDHAELPALKNGAIFVAKNVQDAERMSAELVKENTGFFPMPLEQKGKDGKNELEALSK
jgi:hypothetical protein